MPTLTNNTSTVSEGTITCSNNTSKTNAYVVWNNLNNTTTVYGATRLITHTISFPYDLKITGFKVKNGSYSAGSVYGAESISVYTNSNKTVQIGNTLTGCSANTIYTVSGIPSIGVITNTIFVEGTSTGNAYNCNILGFQITAQKLTSALNSIVFPIAFTSSNTYGTSFSYINGSSATAYISTKSKTGLSLDGVDTNSSSANWIALGY